MTFISCYLSAFSSDNNKIHYLRNTPFNPDAVTLIFLHGFPESSYAWDAYLPHFAELGFNVLAPDLRGNLLSNGFKTLDDFDIHLLTEDVRLLIAKYEAKKVVIIGHDLGGAVAWQLAESYPCLSKALILLNSPHPGAYSRLFRSTPWLTIRQTLRFWYLYVFQLRSIPEYLMLKGGSWWLDYFFKRGIKIKSKGVLSKLFYYKKALGSKAALSSALAVYRKNVFGPYGLRILKHFFCENTYKKITIPVQMLWGESDPLFENKLLHHSNFFCDNRIYIKKYKKGGHWIHHEYLDEMLYHMVNFLTENQLMILSKKNNESTLDFNSSKQLMSLYESFRRGQ